MQSSRKSWFIKYGCKQKSVAFIVCDLGILMTSQLESCFKSRCCDSENNQISKIPSIEN